MLKTYFSNFGFQPGNGAVIDPLFTLRPGLSMTVIKKRVTKQASRRKSPNMRKGRTLD